MHSYHIIPGIIGTKGAAAFFLVAALLESTGTTDRAQTNELSHAGRFSAVASLLPGTWYEIRVVAFRPEAVSQVPLCPQTARLLEAWFLVRECVCSTLSSV